jgi:hypothetical protein
MTGPAPVPTLRRQGAGVFPDSSCPCRRRSRSQSAARRIDGPPFGAVDPAPAPVANVRPSPCKRQGHANSSCVALPGARLARAVPLAAYTARPSAVMPNTIVRSTRPVLLSSASAPSSVRSLMGRWFSSSSREAGPLPSCSRNFRYIRTASGPAASFNSPLLSCLTIRTNLNRTKDIPQTCINPPHFLQILHSLSGGIPANFYHGSTTGRTGEK